MGELREEITVLRGEMEDRESIIRDLDRSNSALANERDTLRDEFAKAERRAQAAEAVVDMRQMRINELTSLLVRTKMEVARKEGYIDRVRESDAGAATTSVRNPALGELDPFLMDDVRSAMTQSDEGTFDRIVSAMSQETLDKVMGKNPNEQSDILR